MLRSFSASDFPAARVLDAKRGRRISVCLPAKDEEATIGATVAAIRTALVERDAVVDELVVIDDSSQDSTAAVAADAGARVLAAADILPEHGAVGGKGQAMWRGVYATTGDIVVFCDADIRSFDPAFVLGLAGPLLVADDVAFVKGFYDRPLDGRPGGGGRVTELMARPLISMLFRDLAAVAQPLAGECAGRREVLESVPFVDGYGVDLGLLIDITARHGISSLVQCDLGQRVHRNRPLSELGAQALAILQLGLARSGLAGTPVASTMSRPDGTSVSVSLTEHPPLCGLPSNPERTSERRSA
ncbi:MAG: glucosyl-3-phosphoglycerate synthase [Acidimicrobiales bacterium]